MRNLSKDSRPPGRRHSGGLQISVATAEHVISTSVSGVFLVSCSDIVMETLININITKGRKQPTSLFVYVSCYN